jgi:hypothetical protein
MLSTHPKRKETHPMKQTVNKSMFMDAFKALRPDNFSYEGLSTLFDYLESHEEELGEEIELDVIALCCDYSEYANIAEAVEECSGEIFDEDNENDALEWLRNYTLALVVEGGGVIVQDF